MEIDKIEQPKKRPVFLTVLGILTFINSGIGLFGALISFLTGPASRDDIEDYMALNMRSIDKIRGEGMDGFADTMQKMINSIQYSNNAHVLSTTLNFGVSALAIIGVILMFRRNKIGFHLYIIGCLLRICSFYFYMPVAEVPGLMVGYFIFTSLLFIFMYSRNLKWLK